MSVRVARSLAFIAVIAPPVACGNVSASDDVHLTCKNGSFYLGDSEFADCNQCSAPTSCSFHVEHVNDLVTEATATCNGETEAIRSGACAGAGAPVPIDGTGGSSGSGGAPPRMPGPPSWLDGGTLPLRDACNVLAKRYCDQDEPCCNKAGYGFSRASCEQQYLDFCARGAERVDAGTVRFNAGAVDQCIDAMQPFADRCLLAPTDLAGVRVALDACAHVFTGLSKTGESCSVNGDCEPLGSNTRHFCKGGVCVVQAIATEGGACSGPQHCAFGLDCVGGRCAPIGTRFPLVSASGCAGATQSP